VRIPVLKLYLKEGVEIRREDFGDLLTSSMPEVAAAFGSTTYSRPRDDNGIGDKFL